LQRRGIQWAQRPARGRIPLWTALAPTPLDHGILLQQWAMMAAYHAARRSPRHGGASARETIAMGYWSFLGATMKYVLLTAAALGVVLAAVAVLIGHADFNMTGEISREDALWFLVGTPLVLGLLAFVVSPLSWLFSRLRLRRSDAISPADGGGAAP
jgi:hypothetical protein